MTSPSSHSKTAAMLKQLSLAFSQIPFNQMLGLQLDHIDTEHVTFNFTMKKELIGNFLHGILHGGVISSVLDMAGGMVVMAAAVQKHVDSPLEELAEIIGKTSTIDLQISYLRPGKGEMFIAKAWLVKSGNKIAFARMELRNQDDVLIATGNGTYLLN